VAWIAASAERPVRAMAAVPSTMQSGGRQGMETMDHCLARLVGDGRITAEVALEHCLDEDDLQRMIGPSVAGPAPSLATSGRR